MNLKIITLTTLLFSSANVFAQGDLRTEPVNILLIIADDMSQGDKGPFLASRQREGKSGSAKN